MLSGAGSGKARMEGRAFNNADMGSRLSGQGPELSEIFYGNVQFVGIFFWGEIPYVKTVKGTDV